MKLLIIGGTGLISSACADLTVQRGHDLTLVNRSISSKYTVPAGARLLALDVHAADHGFEDALQNTSYDSVIDFIAFTEEDIERDLRLFRGKTRQFVFISSASAYQKPPRHYLVTEQTPLENPFWQYSRDKIACEQRLLRAFREEAFPVTIVRPSLTYGPSQIPFSIGSWSHPWTVIQRMQAGKKIVVPGDGTSLWVLTWNADFAKGLLGLLGRSESLGEAYHITSDEVLTWNDIHLEAFRALGLEPNILHVPTDLLEAFWPHAHGSLLGDKSNSMVFDNSKIKRLVPDFRCDVTWAEGLRRSLAWYASHSEFQTLDAEMDRMLDEVVLAMERAFPPGVR